MLDFFFFKKLILSSRAGALVRRIALLSLVGISLSVTCFLLVLFVMNGMNESIQKRLMSLESHLTVQLKNSLDPRAAKIFQGFSARFDSEVTRASLYEYQDVIVRSMDGQFRGAVAKGLTDSAFKNFISQLNDLEKRNKNQSMDVMAWEPDEIPENGEIVMGIDLARSLNVFEGDFLTVVAPEGLILPPGESPPFERVRIRKIISTSLSELDSQFIFYQKGLSLKTFSRSASRQVGLDVWIKTGAQVQKFKEKLISKTPAEDLEPVQIDTWIEKNSALFYALKLEKLMIGIFLALAGLVASSSILTVLTLLVSQKKSDIALLQTLGLSSKKTVRLFTRVGLWLAGIGMAIGLIIGISLGYYIQLHPLNLLPQVYYDSQIPSRVDWFLIFGVVIVGGTIAYLGSWLPARWAAQVQPSEALKQKN